MSTSGAVYSFCDNNPQSDGKAKNDAIQPGTDLSSISESPPVMRRPLSFEEKAWEKVSSLLV